MSCRQPTDKENLICIRYYHTIVLPLPLYKMYMYGYVFVHMQQHRKGIIDLQISVIISPVFKYFLVLYFQLLQVLSTLNT